MEEYNSLEEFIFITKRYPNSEESKQLYNILWNKYAAKLSNDEKKTAIANDKLQDYENGKQQDQRKVIEEIAKSTDKLRKLLENKKGVISVSYNERWGIYSIYIIVNSLTRRKLYRFRDNIPNFFEGWEIKLVPASILQKIILFFRTRKKGDE